MWVPRVMEQGIAEVWWVSPSDIRSWHDSLLSPAERNRMTELRRREDRHRMVVGNALLRLTVAAAVGVAVERVEIDRSCPDCDEPHGRPVVVGHDLHVSVSHSGGRIAVALTRSGPVGVDVEQADPHPHSIADLHAAILSPAEDPDEIDFHTRWVRKEAVLKATGEGLRTPMSKLTLTEAGPAGFDLPCSLYDLRPGTGYAAALAVLTGRGVTVSERDGSELLR
ncbi:4'-phosphopantetheinyl transferase family protein [Streptomyces violascens]|uniref:4'-phosphopantetheinyl transferase family protein n=1 Tax=Streptomyces violascens TaxID=67381 RepID=UPI0036B66A1E